MTIPNIDWLYGRIVKSVEEVDRPRKEFGVEINRMRINFDSGAIMELDRNTGEKLSEFLVGKRLSHASLSLTSTVLHFDNGESSFTLNPNTYTIQMQPQDEPQYPQRSEGQPPPPFPPDPAEERPPGPPEAVENPLEGISSPSEATEAPE